MDRSHIVRTRSIQDVTGRQLIAARGQTVDYLVVGDPAGPGRELGDEAPWRTGQVFDGNGTVVLHVCLMVQETASKFDDFLTCLRDHDVAMEQPAAVGETLPVRVAEPVETLQLAWQACRDIQFAYMAASGQGHVTTVEACFGHQVVVNVDRSTGAEISRGLPAALGGTYMSNRSGTVATDAINTYWVDLRDAWPIVGATDTDMNVEQWTVPFPSDDGQFLRAPSHATALLLDGVLYVVANSDPRRGGCGGGD